jgi:Raf kinase inhibitor-like YbhB/YbcL family protein
MLEKMPRPIGHALKGVRAGLEKTVAESEFAGVPEEIRVESAAFVDGGPIPPRHTADGPGVSPPISWSGVPVGAASLVLIVEDADSPTPEPLVHAIAHGLAGGDGDLMDGGLDGDGPAADDLGKNSFFKTGWLPPDPPTGHGAHRYLVQVYALDQTPIFDHKPGRHAVVEAMRGHVLAKGTLLGVYERK